jgi:hypothetical protein
MWIPKSIVKDVFKLNYTVQWTWLFDKKMTHTIPFV